MTGHVIELDLNCSWLFGTIHSNTTLFLLPHLQRLNLAFNNFYGSSISAGFGQFSSLTHLNLFNSGFSGLISPEISHLSNLVSFDLSWNSNTEFAPHGFNSLVQNLTKLQKLHLQGTSISLVFPNSLLNRSSLISLVLYDCGLHRRFPNHDIHLPKLEVLDLLGNNDLSGNFPRFSENNSLTKLYLSSKNFSGGFPTSINNLKSLQTLDLVDCEFSRSIPVSLENLTQITFLYLSWNHFSGKIRNVFNNLGNLVSLYLSGNNFSGQLPPSIGNLTNLQDLDFSNNQLEGVIPSHVNGFLSLSFVNLRYNLFNGTIPSWLCTLPSLVQLDLSHNKLTGHIGKFQFDSLKKIDLIMMSYMG